MTEWTKKKPKCRFRPGDKVKWSSNFLEESAGSHHIQEALEGYGEGPFVIDEAWITRGREVPGGEDGTWWGTESVIIYKIINGKKHYPYYKRHDRIEWCLPNKIIFPREIAGRCFTKI